MELIYKNLELKVKSTDETGHFSGLANGTEIVDEYGDIIHEGSFKKTIKEHKGKVYVFKGHDSSRQIGITLSLSEDGAYGKGLNIDDALLYVDDTNPKNEIRDAREELIRMRRGAELGVPMGISIGFWIPEGKSEYDAEAGVRHIYEIRLAEISTTPLPANQVSAVADVKSIVQLPALVNKVASACTGPLCPANREAVEVSIKTLQSLLTKEPIPLPKAEPVNGELEADKVLSEPDFHSLMESLKIKI